VPTIHTSGDGLVTPAPLADGTRWDPVPASGEARKRMDQAVFILRNNVRGSASCNNCFKSQPGGRTFDQIFDDANTVLSFDPNGPNSGVTIGSNVTVSLLQNNANVWQVVATICHEFSHVNGVPGGGHGVAESVLRCCGLGGHVRSGTDSVGPGTDSDDDDDSAL